MSDGLNSIQSMLSNLFQPNGGLRQRRPVSGQAQHPKVKYSPLKESQEGSSRLKESHSDPTFNHDNARSAYASPQNSPPKFEESLTTHSPNETPQQRLERLIQTLKDVFNSAVDDGTIKERASYPIRGILDELIGIWESNQDIDHQDFVDPIIQSAKKNGIVKRILRSEILSALDENSDLSQSTREKLVQLSINCS